MTKSLIETVEDTVKTIERQIALINERAPGEFLDKKPVLRSLASHVKNLKAALAEPKPVPDVELRIGVPGEIMFVEPKWEGNTLVIEGEFHERDD